METLQSSGNNIYRAAGEELAPRGIFALAAGRETEATFIEEWLALIVTVNHVAPVYYVARSVNATGIRHLFSVRDN